MDNQDLAALLCSRLCHDLVSPVGAISNGLEILQSGDDPALREQVVDLLEKSASQASHKLQFFRLAFGAGGGFGSELELKEAHSTLSAFLAGTRVTLTWQAPHAFAPKGFIKILLNLALVAAESLIRGGAMTVTVEEQTGVGAGGRYPKLTILAEGQRVILQEQVLAGLRGGEGVDVLEAKAAPAALAAHIAKEDGGAIFVDAGTDGHLELQFVPRVDV